MCVYVWTMYVCMPVCICVLHVWICGCVWVCMYVYVSMYVCVYVCMYVWMCEYVCVCVCEYVCMCECVHMCVKVWVCMCVWTDICIWHAFCYHCRRICLRLLPLQLFALSQSLLACGAHLTHATAQGKVSFIFFFWSMWKNEDRRHLFIRKISKEINVAFNFRRHW
jgi:nuclear pore complex protein Nup62